MMHDHSARIIHVSRPVRTLMKRAVILGLLGAAVMGVLSSKDNSAVSDAVRADVVDAAAPVVSMVAKPVGFLDEIDENIRSYFFAREKNKKLIEENKELKRQLVSLSTMVYEDEGLRKLLNFVKDAPYKFISAKVVGNTSEPFLRSVLISAGKKDNIQKGQAVVNEDGLVGRIVEVGERSSRVLLLTDINSNIPVVSNKSRDRSIVSGNNTESPDLAYLAKDAKITKGEVLLTSGDGGMFPAGLQVGVAYPAGGGAYKVSPFVKWHRLDNVSIIEYVK